MSKTTTTALERDFASVTSVKSKKAIRNTVNSVFKEARGSSGLLPTPRQGQIAGGNFEGGGLSCRGKLSGGVQTDGD